MDDIARSFQFFAIANAGESEDSGDAMTYPKSHFKQAFELKPRERDINSGIKTILELDGWHVFIMETLWRDDWKKGTGEPGMPDMLAIRYASSGIVTPGDDLKAAAEVLWIEGKRSRGVVDPNQRVWHAAERKLGALVWVAGEDFSADVDSFIAHYERSGLCRRNIL